VVLEVVMVAKVITQRQSTTRLFTHANNERSVAIADTPAKTKVNFRLFINISVYLPVPVQRFPHEQMND
jgi:hypothetical protein